MKQAARKKKSLALHRLGFRPEDNRLTSGLPPDRGSDRRTRLMVVVLKHDRTKADSIGDSLNAWQRGVINAMLFSQSMRCCHASLPSNMCPVLAAVVATWLRDLGCRLAAPGSPNSKAVLHLPVRP